MTKSLSDANSSTGPKHRLAQSGVVSSAWDPLQVALLQWNMQDQPPSFAVGSGPEGVAFDGANIWVANRNTVSKL